MNKKMREALKAEEHAAIRYQLDDASITTSGEEATELQTAGQLHMAGIARRIEMPITGQRLPDGQFRFTGRKTLKLSDFGMERPSAVFGTIKTGDEVTVHFEVIAGPTAR